MKVEKRHKLLVDLTEAEAKACLRTAEKIMYHGVIDWKRPEIVMLMDFFDVGDHNRLLIGATVLPQFLLLSYINYLEVNSGNA